MFAKKWLGPLLVILLSVFSFKSLLRPGYFPMHDDMQAMRVLQIDKCLKDGQIPCRWVPDMGYGYGYPQFIYYSPLPYYLMEFFHLIGLPIIDSVKAGIVLGFIASGLAMYLLGSSLWGEFGGLVCSIFYIYNPYHASDIYTRGAMGEFWAFVFLPLIFWAVLEYVRKEKFKYLTFLALSIGGLLTSHNITSVAFFPIGVVWVIFLLWYYKKFKLLLTIVLSSLWGLGFAAFFILPAFFEKKFVHVETMTMGYFNFLAHFVSLKQLFISTHWGYGSSELGQYDDLSFNVGFFHWLFSALALIISLFFRKKEKIFPFVILFFMIGLGSVFMTHQRSVFIWNNLSFLSYFQFPWRFLTLVSFATSVLAGYLILVVKEIDIKIFLGTFMILGVIYFNMFYFRPREWYQITDADKFSGDLWEKQLTISIFDYLPIFARVPPSSKAPDFPIILEGKGEVKEFKKGTDWQKGTLDVEEPVKVQLPIYYFPGMKVWIDNKEVNIDYHNQLGLVNFFAPVGKHDFKIKLLRTPIRMVGDVLTIVSFFVLGVQLIYAQIKKQ